MICRFCPVGKRIRRSGQRWVRCILYGIVVKEDHECTREGWKDVERDEKHGAEFGGEAELPEDGGDVAEFMPGILPGSGE